MNSDNINKKINDIDKLLSDEFAFQNYINKIDNMNTYVSDNLEEKIKLKLKLKRNLNYKNVIKIAASTIFAIAFWNLIDSTDTLQFNNLDKISYENDNLYSYINDKMNDINGFMMSPIELKKEE